MYVPKRILVNTGQGPASNGNSNKNHVPAGYYSDDEDDYDYDPDRYSPPKPKLEPTVTLMTPPGKLTINEIDNEERRRFVRDTSLNRGTPNDTILSNLQSGDPVNFTKQLRHLHNRVRLLEEELQSHNNRQVFMIGVMSVYFISRCLKWISS